MRMRQVLFAATVDDAQNSSNSMPDNPNATLPETVSENISDDSTVVSENLAVTPEGDVQNIETGETVTDAQLAARNRSNLSTGQNGWRIIHSGECLGCERCCGTTCETVCGAVVLEGWLDCPAR